MNSRPPPISKWRFDGFLKIVQGPPLREVFQDLMRSMRNLPLAPYDLAEFLRLAGYDEICEKEVPDADLPILVAMLQRFLSKSTDELLEILESLRAREWPPVRLSLLGPVLETSDSHHEPSVAPAFPVPSFHDPPGRERLGSFVDHGSVLIELPSMLSRWDGASRTLVRSRAEIWPKTAMAIPKRSEARKI